MEHARIHYCKDGQPPGRQRTFVSHSGSSV
jgi:hypothetical protein